MLCTPPRRCTRDLSAFPLTVLKSRLSGFEPIKSTKVCTHQYNSKVITMKDGNDKNRKVDCRNGKSRMWEGDARFRSERGQRLNDLGSGGGLRWAGIRGRGYSLVRGGRELGGVLTHAKVFL